MIDNIPFEERVINIQNIIIYGDCHISEIGRDNIKKLYEDNKDIDCVALELDKKRYTKLHKPAIPKIISLFFRKMKLFNEYYGRAMRETDKIAIKNKINIELIDIEYKFKINPMSILIQLKGLKKEDIDMKKISQETINIEEIENKDIKRLYELNEKREKFMAEKLYQLSKKNKKILAIVGLRHMKKIRNKINLFSQ